MILVDHRHTTDPYINLAIEEYLVRNADCSKHDYLFLYVNEPCIVVGKNQSIYREVHVDYLRNNQLKLARRVSGGGTVYHDAGNVNFAFITAFHESKINNYRHFNTPVVEALNNAGVRSAMDERNNIVCHTKKISGNAQFTNRKNIISHGTLLVNANLAELRAALKENDFSIETKAVASVKSSVMNLAEVSPALSNSTSVTELLKSALNCSDVKTFDAAEWQAIQQLADEQYRSYEWIYGRSPHTILHKPDAVIEVDKGLIAEIKSEVIPHQVLSTLAGVRYEYAAIKKALEMLPNASVYLDVIF
ncbi:MAG: lipoate--protein ligase [Chitinophagales bacterium]|nr:lipoate--protein ligase [Chitinophagales bacterium]